MEKGKEYKNDEKEKDGKKDERKSSMEIRKTSKKEKK